MSASYVIPVKVDSARPLLVEADANSFGLIFASMDSRDQVEVLRAMVRHMKDWPTQWDHIGIELELDENREVYNAFKGMLNV